MNALQKYFNYRQALIDQYIKGDMTKREYLERNLDAVLSLNIKPFRNVDTVDKALFNYQYYNAMAKDANINITGYSDKEYEQILHEKSNYYYNQKDRATMRVLELLNYTNVRAYFIKVKSKYLKNRLFEIILEDTNTVLHSSNEVILKRLKEENVFTDGVKRSVIDSYINQRYY